MTWTQVGSTDTFAGRGPQTAGNVGNSWIDPLSVWSINGSTLGTSGLVGTTTINTQGATVTGTDIIRPSSEFSGAGGMRGVIQFTAVASAGSVARTVVMLHYQDNANYYEIYNTSSTVVINKVTSGTQAVGNLASASYTFAGAALQLDFWAYQTGPAATTIGFSLTTNPGGTVVASASVVDTTSALQPIGTIGSHVYAVTPGTSASSNAITSYAWYTGTPPGNATALSLYGPSTATNGFPSSNFTVTPNNSGCASTCTVTLSDAANGGTFKNSGGTTITTLTFNAGDITPQTFTYTPASNGTKSISITDSLSLTHTGSPISLVVGAASIAISPTSVPARQPAPARQPSVTSGNAPTLLVPNTGGAVITVTGTGTNFQSSDTWTVTNPLAPSTPLIGASLLSVTTNSTTSVTLRFDPGPQYPGNPYGTPSSFFASNPLVWGNLTITNVTAGLTATLTVATPTTAPAFPPGLTSAGPINVLFIGDSITASDTTPTNVYGDLGTYTVNAMKAKGATVNWYATAAVDGSWTDQWRQDTYYSHNTGLDGGALVKINGSAPVASNFDNFGTGTTPGVYFNRAVAAATSARGSSTVTNNDYVHIMLYTNEITGNKTHLKGPITVAAHLANMTAICAQWVALGFKVILAKPPYTWPNANLASNLPWPPCDFTGSSFPNAFTSYTTQYPHEIYQLMWEADQALIDGVHVFQGDTTAAEYSFNNPNTFLQDASVTSAPGIHPSAGAAQALYGEMWSNGILFASGASTGGGGGSNGGGRIIGG